MAVPSRPTTSSRSNLPVTGVELTAVLLLAVLLLVLGALLVQAGRRHRPA